jgi:CRP-like cAMP-binding protein
LKRKRFPQGAVIIRQGEADDSVYLVESGLLQVVTTAEDADEDNTVDQTQAYIGPGSFAGELAPLLGRPRSATVKVVIDADLWVLRKQDLDELLAEQPSIHLHFTRELGQRLVARPRKHQSPAFGATIGTSWCWLWLTTRRVP